MRQRIQPLLICTALAALTLASYWPVLHHGFTSLDDNDYVTHNSRVQSGLGWENCGWAFSTFHAANWHPLTWLSHMLDVQLFGLEGSAAGLHHLTNLVLHVANTLLLFWFFKRMTGALWRSAFVAALFALHPLHVESVAWVAERKEVLSAFFFILTVWAYASYVYSSGSAVHSPQCTVHSPQSTVQSGWSVVSRRWYIAALMLFALGLMAKPMLVTLPFVLLLLDVWPLGRVWNPKSTAQSPRSAVHGPQSAVQRLTRPKRGPTAEGRAWMTKDSGQWSVVSSARSVIPRLLAEKVPFLALSLASCWVTVLAQRHGRAMLALHDYGIWGRLENAVAAYLKYLWKTIWPADLAILYPHPFMDPAEQWPAWECAAGALVLIGVSVLAILRLRRQSWFATGWFWFLGMLVPVIGLVQVGNQAMADRYSYLPLIGVFVVVAWAMGSLSDRLARRSLGEGGPGKSRKRPLVTSALCVAALLLCAALTRQQVNIWQDDVTLFEQPLKLSDKNAPAHAQLALAMGREGKYGFALAQCRAALQADESHVPAWHLAGEIYALLDNPQAAITNYETALRWNRGLPLTWFKLAQARSHLGEADQAERCCRNAIEYDPDLVEAHNQLGAYLLSGGKRVEALEQFGAAARLGSPEGHYNLGVTSSEAGDLARAQRELEQALRLKPDNIQALAALLGVLMKQGKNADAQARAGDLDRLCPNTAKGRFQVGAALLHSGLTNEARRAFADALRLKPDLPQASLEAGKALLAQGQLPNAEAAFQAVLWVQPDNIEAHERLGVLLVNRGRAEEALPHLREALRLRENQTGLPAVALAQAGPTGPSSLTETRYHLALALAMAGKLPDALACYQQVLQAAPDYKSALNDLAWIRATAPQADLRNGREAVALAERACEGKGGTNPDFLGSLAAAYAEAGKFADAVKTQQKALELARAAGDKAGEAKSLARLELYQQGQPCRQ